MYNLGNFCAILGSISVLFTLIDIYFIYLLL
jgi:hypothetical protein